MHCVQAKRLLEFSIRYGSSLQVRHEAHKKLSQRYSYFHKKTVRVLGIAIPSCCDQSECTLIQSHEAIMGMVVIHDYISQ